MLVQPFQGYVTICYFADIRFRRVKGMLAIGGISLDNMNERRHAEALNSDPRKD